MKPDDNIQISSKRMRRNYFLVALALGVVVVLILYKSFYTYFVEGSEWRNRGKALVRPNIEVQPPRGNIYSCHYELMATTEFIYRAYIDFWADGLNGDTLKKYVDPLSKEMNKEFPEISADRYKAHLMKGWNMRVSEENRIKEGKRNVRKTREYPLMPVQRRLNFLEMKSLRSMPFLRQNKNKSGLITRRSVKRTKPYGTLASRTIGDIYGEYEKGGKNGLEMQYDELLKGVPGTSTYRKVNGSYILVPDIEPIPGKDIVSTIDIEIQDITEKALLDKLQEIDAESGTAVVMEVATGEIKAITNMGRYREGVWTETKNFAVADQTEPGSTFKVASMMVALEDGVIHPSDSVETGNGIFMYAGNPLRDHNWHRGGYGRISAEQAIWFSSNIGVAKIILKGYEGNPTKYVEGLYKIGWNIPLDLEIPGAGKAKIRKPDDKERYWSKTTLPWMSFGYETQIPPIYTLTFFNAIANNGTMMKPYFVKEIRQDGKVEERRKPEVLRDKICSTRTLEQIQEMLLGVVEGKGGTGGTVRSKHIRIAGKTGTAQISQGAAGYRGGGVSHQVSFCGYFPADKPKYSCIVVIRKPRIGYPSGGTMSGGVFKRVAEEVNARLSRMKTSEILPDTVRSVIPAVKSGMEKPTTYLLSKLDVSYDQESKGDWVVSEVKDTKVEVKDRSIIDNLVPNVVGMGAKDAVYLLEKSGLRVNLAGRGAVRSQSILPGAKIVRGQTIGLTLQ